MTATFTHRSFILGSAAVVGAGTLAACSSTSGGETSASTTSESATGANYPIGQNYCLPPQAPGHRHRQLGQRRGRIL